MVVVCEVAEPESLPERRRFGTTTSELRRLSQWLRAGGVEEAVMGIDGAALEAGVVRTGTISASAVGASVLQAVRRADASTTSRSPNGWYGGWWPTNCGSASFP